MDGSVVVVGCAAVDASPDWLRLHTPGGLRTIPWIAIKMAALPTNDGSMTFSGAFEPITALRETHDPLWIESGEGTAIALLEKNHPKRESILAAFKEHLESRWLGDRLTAAEAAQRLFSPARAVGSGFSKLAIVALAAMILMFLLAFILSRFVRH